MPLVPHFRVPMRLDADGSFATVEQDSDDDVTQCAVAILTTPQGRRPLTPALGMPDTTHLLTRPDDSETRVVAANQLDTFEPRARYAALAAQADLNNWIDTITVDLEGAATNG